MADIFCSDSVMAKFDGDPNEGRAFLVDCLLRLEPHCKGKEDVFQLQSSIARLRLVELKVYE